VREAALQFVCQVNGSTYTSRATKEAFERAIDEVAVATRRLLDGPVTNALPKSRELERVKHLGHMAHRWVDYQMRARPARPSLSTPTGDAHRSRTD
jgi:hypothetical protein